MLEAETHASPISDPAAAPARPRRRRGKRFWIILAASIALGLPLLLLLALWAWINLGFMNASLERRLSKKFGTPAHIGAIKSNGFENLRIDEVAIEPRGEGQPLTIGATKLEVGPLDFYFNNR